MATVTAFTGVGAGLYLKKKCSCRSGGGGGGGGIRRRNPSLSSLFLGRKTKTCSCGGLELGETPITIATAFHPLSISLSQIRTKQPSQPPPPPLFFKTSRRDAIFFIFSFLSLSKTRMAFAFSFGIPGPKEWLKDQKKKTSRFILAPIDASRNTLQDASVLLRSANMGISNKDLAEFQRLLKAAARDCVQQERDSFVAFQSQTGVEVCTFRLIFQNASSLLDDRNPQKLEAEALLGDLISSLSHLSDILNNCDLQLPSDRQKVENGLMDSISVLNKFEQGIKNCLDV